MQIQKLCSIKFEQGPEEKVKMEDFDKKYVRRKTFTGVKRK